MSGIDFSSRISYEPYHIYYDLSILNNDTTGSKQPPFLEFTEIRNSPYLANPSDYFASVVRFSVETPTLPLIVPQPRLSNAIPAPASVNELIYQVSMNHPALPAPISIFVNYIPQSSATVAPPPTSIQNAQDLINEYYYTYTYKPFIDMVNIALRQCFTLTINALGAPIAAQYVNATQAVFPYLYWDDDKSIATFVAPAQLFQTPTANNLTPQLNALLPAPANAPIELYFNAPLFNLFSSFTAVQNAYQAAIPPAIDSLNWRILFPDTVTLDPYAIVSPQVAPAPPAGGMPTFPQVGGLPFAPYQPASPYDLLRVSQEYPTTPLWNPVQAIVFTTSLLPIHSSIVSSPVLFGAGANFTTSGNNSGIANILTDLEVSTEKGWQTKPNISYVPTAEYRLFDLNGNAPLSAIQITVSWKDTFGRLNPLRLGSGSNASIKLMFRRKDFQGVV
jgi:hypothetical protein